MSKCKEVEETRPEFDWIRVPNLRAKARQTWMPALVRRPRQLQDLREIARTQPVEGCIASSLTHACPLVELAGDSELKLAGFTGDDRPVGQDILNAEAILADVGKSLVYEMVNGKRVQFVGGACVPHPFHGVGFVKQTYLLSQQDPMTPSPFVQGCMV